MAAPFHRGLRPAGLASSVASRLPPVAPPPAPWGPAELSASQVAAAKLQATPAGGHESRGSDRASFLSTGRCGTRFRSDESISLPATARSGARGPHAFIGHDSLVCHGKPTRENQDAIFAQASRSQMLVGVFDGHGDDGHKVSGFVKEELPRRICKDERLHADPGSVLRDAYRKTHKRLEHGAGGDAFHSGCTAVAAYKDRDRLFVANVGDSRAVLGRISTPAVLAGGAVSSRLQAVQLSQDQTPMRPDERARIQSLNGAVHPTPVRWVPQYGSSGYFECAGPDRVWDRSGTCGVGVTRALGDQNMAPFLTPEPEVIEKRLDNRDRLLVLGSDGVWDMLANDEAVEIAGRHRDAKAAAREITELARQRWNTNTQGTMQDDISAVVVHLTPGSPVAGRGSVEEAALKELAPRNGLPTRSTPAARDASLPAAPRKRRDALRRGRGRSESSAANTLRAQVCT